MKSILFGSIGVLVESSEIQRKAFNKAFKEFGLDWYWNAANYIKMLEKPGGLNRIAEYSKFKLSENEVKEIHNLKVKHFKYLSKNKFKPRKGILKTINYGLKNKIKIGFITTTNKLTLDLVTEGLSDFIDFSKNRGCVFEPSPADKSNTERLLFLAPGRGDRTRGTKCY